MTTLFQLVIGSTTYDLNDGNNSLSEYAHRMSDGINPVTESAVVLVAASTADNLLTQIKDINRANMAAKRRSKSKQGDRIFLKWRVNGAAPILRSEILAIAAVPADDPTWGLPSGFANRKIKLVLSFTRVGWREYDTLTQIPLTNDNATADLAGLKIYNCNDGTGAAGSVRVNYVQMAAADILGDMETPLYIEITHTFAASAARRFYIAHKAQGVPASFVHTLECEDASPGTGVTSTADLDCSGGNKMAVVNVPATVRTLMTWTLSTTQASYILSQWVKILARFEDLPNNSTCKVRFIVQDSVTTAQIGQSEWVTLSSADYLQQIGTIMLSPNEQGQVTAGAIKLLLQGKDSAATCDFGMDFIQPSPSELGQGFVLLKPIDEALVTVAASTGVITDNAIDDTGPQIESRQRVYLRFGGPIMLVPNTINRIYILHDGTDASAAVARTLTVKAWHRPRVTTVG
jgi:hypothetical protein